MGRRACSERSMVVECFAWIVVSFDSIALVLMTAILGIVGIVFARPKAHRALALLLASIIAIPYWVGLSIGIQIPAVVVVAAALAAGFKSTGLDVWIGQQLSGIQALPVWMVILTLCLGITFLTEFTSNTATATMILPVIAGAAVMMDTHPLLLMVPVTLSASFAFMMPVATPPNAIVFGSGRVTVTAQGIKTFAGEFDPQPFHRDEEAARGSLFGGLVASVEISDHSGLRHCKRAYRSGVCLIQHQSFIAGRSSWWKAPEAPECRVRLSVLH